MLATKRQFIRRKEYQRRVGLRTVTLPNGLMVQAMFSPGKLIMYTVKDARKADLLVD